MVLHISYAILVMTYSSRHISDDILVTNDEMVLHISYDILVMTY